MVYLLVARPIDYLGLYRKGSMHDANACPYVVYPQLVKKKLPLQSPEYRVVNDGFIFVIIQIIKGDNAKIILVEVVAWIKKIGAYYIHFKTFTYIQEDGILLCTKKLL